MRLTKTTAMALALAVGGLSAPITSPLAAEKIVKKTVVEKPNGNRVVTKKTVIRREGVRQEGDRYFYGGRYYDQDEAIAAGIIGFSAGAILGGALAQ